MQSNYYSNGQYPLVSMFGTTKNHFHTVPSYVNIIIVLGLQLFLDREFKVYYQHCYNLCITVNY